MSILLTLLKIIGILLLVVIGLLLGILFIVLMVPIRYRLQGARSAEEGALTAGGRVSWLASILAVTFVYDREFSWKVRIFGIPLKMKKKEISEDEIEDLTEDQEAEIAALEAELAKENAATPFAQEKPLILQTQEASGDEMEASQEEAEASEATPEGEEQKVPAGQKIKEMLHSLPDKMHSLRETLASIPDKIRSIKQQADTWIAFAKSDEMKRLISTCWKEIKQILRHLLPTKLRIQGNYGFADPSLTGQITGILCMLPKRYQKSIHLQPHFQEECLDGECMLKGRIRLGSLLWPVVKILLKPCTWKVYKRFRVITKPKETVEGGSQQGTEWNDSCVEAKKKISGPAGKNKKEKRNRSKNDPHKGGK